MAGDNRKGKKPKIFVKSNNSDSSVNDEFYEYDKLKASSNVLDESFFEDFKSVDFEKLNYEKEHPVSEEMGEDTFSSNDNIEDEVIQEIPEKENMAENEFQSSSYLNLNDTNSDKQVELEDDDDFGSLESNESITQKEASENLFYDEENGEEGSIFNQYEIANTEESSKESNYESLFETSQVVANESEDDDDFGSMEENNTEEDDDFGSLDNDIDMTQTTYVNVNQKANYYDEVIDRHNESEDNDDEEEEDDEYYIDKKGNKKKRKRGLRLFLKFMLTFLLACAGIMVYFGLTHDLFKIDYVKVVGNVANEKELIVSKSGVNIGDNIFLTSSSKIEKNLKALSNIENVKVRKNYPNIIEIEVKENYVSSYINTASGLTTIDNYGKVKEVATDNSKASGAQLKGISETDLKVGEDFSNDTTKVKFLVDILSKEYYPNVVSIDFTNDKEIVIQMKNSLKVTFGDLNDYAKKTQIIGILLKKIQVEGINAKEIILNVGDNPIIVKK